MIKLGRNSDGGEIWHCRCDCGAWKSFSALDIKTGAVTTCGHRKNQRGDVESNKEIRPILGF